ncbi:MAG TPA: D-alanine--D-alanine ligase [Chthonomonadales bacterium]|nr:D-alanine--D-alanine ligase [Chthonomonadales bacterium]
MSRLKVAVLMGGASAERAISLSTGRQIVAALDRAKYDVRALDPAALAGAPIPSAPPSAAGGAHVTAPGVALAPGVELAPARIERLAPREGPDRPDVAFIALHGRGGEDGAMQGMLDLLGIPYTGSGVLASALAMDKAMAKLVLRARGVPVPEHVATTRRDLLDAGALRARVADTVGYPAIVKPNAEGSTIGCTRATAPEDLEAAVREALRHDTLALVEPMLQGVEITAGVLGNDEPCVLPLIEIVAKGGFYDYEAKYAPGGSTHIIPARISERAAERARHYAAESHRALGCRGMSRTDFIVVDDEPWTLELNTVPGMTPTSLLPEAAHAAGIEFPALLDRLIALALEPRA